MSPIYPGDPMVDDPLPNERVVNKPLIVIAAVVLLAALGGWYLWHRHQAEAPAAPMAAVAPEPSAAPAAEDVIAHPVPAAPSEAAVHPLPALGDSDGEITAALGGAVGGDSLARFLVPENVIRHIVVTVDNLPRQKVAVDKRPVVPVGGSFMVDGDELHATLDSRNFARYQPLMSMLEKADMQQVAAVYLRFYPLFQKAYQDLGYPNGYFNDRLVAVIDLLLATPQPAGPLELARPNVMYVYADPSLESRPAGQKLLIRMGPDNAAAVKAKLMQLRAIVTAAPPKH